MVLAWVAAGCADPTASLPNIEDAGPSTIAGVVYHDDGDGQLGPDDQPVKQLITQLGQMTQLIGVPSTQTTTSDRGHFVLEVPSEIRDRSDLFVQITIPVTGPDDAAISTHVRVPVEAGDVAVAVPLPTPNSCSSSVDDVVAGTTACGTAMLPDLVPLVGDFGQSPTQPVAANSVRTDITTLSETVLLRFASATANLGAGPLHMIPASKPDGDQLPTWQRIWTDDHRFVDHQTGTFIFHESHDHFHLEGFEQYRLLTPAGDEVAVGKKISFCLIDAVAATPDAQRRGFGIFLDLVCEDAGDQQALNPGWADYYGAGLADQWIDITGVAPGDYLVEIVADPDNLLIESDETNNRATFPVTLTAQQLDGD